MKFINSKPIAILLAVYNGGRYLAEQFDSLIAQTNQDWTLYIRDDVSTDNSSEIISKYCSQYPNFIVVENNKNTLGCRDNFFYLLECIDSDYYMFCDQDDVWLPQKIEMTFASIRQKERIYKGESVVIFTDLKIVDNKLNEISASFWAYSKINPVILTKFNYLSVCNVMTGCTMMLNKKAYNIIFPVSPTAIMHDCWIALKVVASGGHIFYINEPTILYRQHDSNVVGVKEINKGYIISKIKSIREVIKQNRRNFLMVQTIKKTSIGVYLYHKLLYMIKR